VTLRWTSIAQPFAAEETWQLKCMWNGSSYFLQACCVEVISIHGL